MKTFAVASMISAAVAAPGYGGAPSYGSPAPKPKYEGTVVSDRVPSYGKPDTPVPSGEVPATPDTPYTGGEVPEVPEVPTKGGYEPKVPDAPYDGTVVNERVPEGCTPETVVETQVSTATIEHTVTSTATATITHTATSTSTETETETETEHTTCTEHVVVPQLIEKPVSIIVETPKYVTIKEYECPIADVEVPEDTCGGIVPEVPDVPVTTTGMYDPYWPEPTVVDERYEPKGEVPDTPVVDEEDCEDEGGYVPGDYDWIPTTTSSYGLIPPTSITPEDDYGYEMPEDPEDIPDGTVVDEKVGGYHVADPEEPAEEEEWDYGGYEPMPYETPVVEEPEVEVPEVEGEQPEDPEDCDSEPEEPKGYTPTTPTHDEPETPKEPETKDYTPTPPTVVDEQVPPTTADSDCDTDAEPEPTVDDSSVPPAEEDEPVIPYKVSYSPSY
eukprot:TRINITY_DN6380_c0_g1_i1.p1 TRINITY_DN6380_c0_g1~~TRINITY_DN6380_c0_g1_i1.p1  ORF type:complete len:443 (-),score=110.65 TRINITY_DN6380_c0_g1_i1:72-1400(-)